MEDLDQDLTARLRAMGLLEAFEKLTAPIDSGVRVPVTSGPPSSWWEWVGKIAAQSSAFRSEVDRLRTSTWRNDSGGHLRSRSLFDYPLSVVAAWPEKHSRRYITRCRRVASRYLGSPDAASALHELVRGEGYLIEMPRRLGSPPPPPVRVRPILASYIAGNRGAAQRKAWSRHSPGSG